MFKKNAILTMFKKNPIQTRFKRNAILQKDNFIEHLYIVLYIVFWCGFFGFLLLCFCLFCFFVCLGFFFFFGGGGGGGRPSKAVVCDILYVGWCI